jgi:hypothetical protein
MGQANVQMLADAVAGASPHAELLLAAPDAASGNADPASVELALSAIQDTPEPDSADPASPV